VETVIPGSAIIRPGDEILVPLNVDKKCRQFCIDLLEIIYKSRYWRKWWLICSAWD